MKKILILGFVLLSTTALADQPTSSVGTCRDANTGNVVLQMSIHQTSQQETVTGQPLGWSHSVVFKGGPSTVGRADWYSPESGDEFVVNPGSSNVLYGYYDFYLQNNVRVSGDLVCDPSLADALVWNWI